MATAAQITRRQQAALPKEDLREYAGRWVALRDGHVIASARSRRALRANPAVTLRDVVRPVPPRSNGLIL